MEDHSGLLRFIYIAFAAFAGAINALAFTKWREMSWIEISLTLIGGFSFAVFVTPWVADAFFKVDPSNVRTVAALTYLFGSGSNVLLPILIRSMGRALGHGETK